LTITFLGTGTSQGIPVIACECEVCRSIDFRDKRLRTSIHIEKENKSFIVDTGPDFRQQVLRERIKSLDAVIFTHEHKDHTAGLDDIRGFNFKQRKDMPLYAREHVLEQLKKEFSYAFGSKKYPGVPMIRTNVVENKPFEIEGITFEPIEVMHHKLPVFGYRIDNFTYITDANFIREKELQKVKGTQILVLNALQKKEHLSHFNLNEAIELIAKINPKEAYLTHISHKLGLHQEVSEKLPENVALAYDGLKISL